MKRMRMRKGTSSRVLECCRLESLEGRLCLSSTSAASAPDIAGPRVISSSVQQGDVVAPGTVAFTIGFNEPVKTNVGAATFWLFYNGSQSSPSPSSVVFSAAADSVTVQYINVAEGHYTFRVDGGLTHIVDLAGNALDGETPTWPIGPNQSGDGVPGGNFAVPFTVDADTLPFPALTPGGPGGSGAYTNNASRYVDVDDADSFSLDVAKGQLFTVKLQNNLTLQAHVEIFDPLGNLLESVSATSPGQGLLLTAVASPAGGTYTIRLTGVDKTFGNAIVWISLNAVEESERFTGVTNDTLATAQDLDPALLPAAAGSPSKRAVVMGYANVSDGDLVDYYRITLQANDRLTVLNEVDEVFDPDGKLICQVRRPGELAQQHITNLKAAATGTYYLHVPCQSMGNRNYTVSVAVNAEFEAEPNNTSATAEQSLGPNYANSQIYLGTADYQAVDWYALNLVAGTPVTVSLRIPGRGPGAPDNRYVPGMLLNSTTANLAAAFGTIDDDQVGLTYTPTISGIYMLELFGSPNPNSDYVLQIDGASTTPSPFTATSIYTELAVLNYQVAPTSFDIRFNDPVDLRTLDAGDLLVDGVPATDLSISNNVATFLSPLQLGEGSHTLAIAAGAVKDIRGVPVSAYNAQVVVDSTGPRVVSSSIQEDQLAPKGNLTLTIGFDEPMLTGLLDVSDFQLFGIVKARGYSASSFSFDPAHTTLTLAYQSLPEDRYSLTLVSGREHFEDAHYNALDGEPHFPMPPNQSGDGTPSGNFVLDFTLDAFAPVALPTPAAVTPVALRAYETTATGFLHSTSDTDSFTLNLDAGQSLTASLSTAIAFLGTLQVLAPDGSVIGSTIAPSVDRVAIVQTAAVNAAGLYTIVVSSADAGAGAYTLTAGLNLAKELESAAPVSNDSQASAQSLNPGMTTLAPGIRSTAVTGAFDSLFFADFESGINGFTVDNSLAAGLWHLSTGRGTQSGHSATHSFYFGTGEGPGGGGSYDTGARTAGYLTSPPITLPTGYPITLGFNYVLHDESGFEKATLQLTNNGGQSWTSLASYTPTDTTSGWKAAPSISLTSRAGQTVQLRFLFDSIDQVNNAYEGWYVDDVRIQGYSSTPDMYSASFAAGDHVTLLTNSVAAAGINMALLDAGGNVLASASSVAGGLSVLLDQIAIPADGTYFIRLTGASAASYALSLLANSAIDAEPNNTLATAQDISKTGAAFGNISGNDDYYAINVPAADGIITLQTWTPSDGAGYYTNGLNPTIALYDPTGKLVASDDNSAGDGHNALLVRSVSAGGRYVVRVYGGAGAGVSGEYVLRTSYRLQGDVNGDRTVDTADFVILLRHYGQHNPPFADGDLNGDGEVGFVDFQIFERAFGQTIVTPLPVPATIPLQMNASSKKTSSFFSEIPIKPKPITPVAKPSPPPKRLSLRR